MAVISRPAKDPAASLAASALGPPKHSSAACEEEVNPKIPKP